jgi:hypothetical protein
MNTFAKIRSNDLSRYYVMHYANGDELKRVALNPESPYKLVLVEEALELYPELDQPANIPSFSLLAKLNPATKHAGGGSDLYHGVAGIPVNRKTFPGKKKPAAKGRPVWLP